MVELNGTELGNVQQTMFDYGMSYCVGRLHFCLSGLDITISGRVLWGENGDRYQQKKLPHLKWIHQEYLFCFLQQATKGTSIFMTKTLGHLSCMAGRQCEAASPKNSPKPDPVWEEHPYFRRVCIYIYVCVLYL